MAPIGKESIFTSFSMRIAVIGKNTFRKQSPLEPLLSTYAKVLSDIHRLISRTATFPITIKQIHNIIQVLPKNLERSQSVANELRLIEELDAMVETWLQKRKKGGRPVDLVITFRKINEVVIDRIRQAVFRVGQKIDEDPSSLKLLYFIRQMEATQGQLELWASQRPKRPFPSTQNRISYCFPEEKSTKAGTTHASTIHTRNQSKYDSKHYQDNLLSGGISVIKRSSTASKVGVRPKTGTQWRCPSALDINKQQHQNLQRMKSEANLKKQNRHFAQTIAEEEYSCQKPSQRSHFRTDNNKKPTHLYTGGIDNEVEGKKVVPRRRISILNEASMCSEGSLNLSGAKSITNRKSGFSRIARDRDNQQSSKSCLQESESSREESIKETSIHFDRRLTPKKTKFQQSKFNNMSHFGPEKSENSSSQSSIQVDPQFQEKYMKLKQQRLFKRVRRSAKILKKEDAESIEESVPRRQIMTKPSEFSKLHRRAGQKLIRNRSLKNKRASTASVNASSAQPFQSISYTQQALVNPIDLSRRKNKKVVDSVIMNDPTPDVLGQFGSLFSELNAFLSGFKDGQTEKDKAIFFEQQERAWRKEDKQRKQRRQILLQKQLGLPSHFQLACRISRDHEGLYDMLDRQMSFKAEAHRLKGQQSDTNLLQKGI